MSAGHGSVAGMSIPVIKPTRGRVAVRRSDVEKVTPGGLIIPDTAKQEKAAFGIVEAVGSGLPDKHGNIIPIEVQVGQEVIVGRWLGEEIPDLGDGASRIVIREEEILATIER